MKFLNLFSPYAWLWLFITAIEYIWFDTVTANDITTISVVIFLNFLLQLFTIHKKGEPIISFFTAFVTFFYVFHFGQVVLMGLFPHYSYNYLNYITVYMTNEALYISTLKLCVVCINMFVVGGLFFHHPPVSWYISREYIINKKNVGKKMFYILLPFRIGLDALQISVALVGGYKAAIILTNAIPGYLATFANMWYAVVPLYYLELKTKRDRQQYVFIVVLYMCVTMITGNRGHQMVSIVSIFIIVLLFEPKITMWQWIKYTMFAMGGMLFIDIIYDLRNVGVNAFLKDYSNSTETPSNFNIILETIGTFGETIYTPYLVIKGYDSTFSPFWGECFLKSIFAVIPDFTGTFKDINNQAIFTKQLGTQNAIGGSFCGEMYYNFGNSYPILSMIIGFVFSNVSYRIIESIKSGNYYKILFWLPFAVLFIWWVRDAIGNMTRQVVWLVIIIHLLKSKVLVKLIMELPKNISATQTSK